MPLLHLFILALVQGITEFLPISSSAHLVLVPVLTGWPDQGLLLDVAVHVGTLAAVLIYFHRDTRGLVLAALGSFGVAPARRAVAGTRYRALFWALVLATLPVVIVGLGLKLTGLYDAMRSAYVIAFTSIGFGLLLYWADQRMAQGRTLDNMTLKSALLIGVSQILALIPGTSRAGITMTAGRALGFKRVDAARFSMLLAIPVIVAAGMLGAVDLIQDGANGQWRDALIGAGFAFLAALVSVHFLVRWLERASMTIFVVYRVALGIGLLLWLTLV